MDAGTLQIRGTTKVLSNAWFIMRLSLLPLRIPIWMICAMTHNISTDRFRFGASYLWKLGWLQGGCCHTATTWHPEFVIRPSLLWIRVPSKMICAIVDRISTYGCRFGVSTRIETLVDAETLQSHDTLMDSNNTRFIIGSLLLPIQMPIRIIWAMLMMDTTLN